MVARQAPHERGQPEEDKRREDQDLATRAWATPGHVRPGAGRLGVNAICCRCASLCVVHPGDCELCAGAAKQGLVSTLRVFVAAGESGPILTLSGEADVTNADQLRDAISAQLASGTVYLTIDAAELSFADSGSIGILAGTAKSLNQLGGRLVLLRPQDSLVRTLTLLGVDQVLTVHRASGAAHERDCD